MSDALSRVPHLLIRPYQVYACIPQEEEGVGELQALHSSISVLQRE